MHGGRAIPAPPYYIIWLSVCQPLFYARPRPSHKGQRVRGSALISPPKHGAAATSRAGVWSRHGGQRGADRGEQPRRGRTGRRGERHATHGLTLEVDGAECYTIERVLLLTLGATSSYTRSQRHTESSMKNMVKAAKTPKNCAKSLFGAAQKKVPRSESCKI